MPIHHMLYLCPECGHDPLRGVARRAECQSCGAVFERGRGSTILVTSPGGPTRVSTAKELLEATEARANASLGTSPEDGADSHRARIAIGRAQEQHVVSFDGHVLGFSERVEPEGEGILCLEGDRLTLLAEGRDPRVWTLDSIGAILISSLAIQINLLGRGLYQLEFLEDSPKRWEDLVHTALRSFYAARGRVVIRFQPQIVTEPLP